MVSKQNRCNLRMKAIFGFIFEIYTFMINVQGNLSVAGLGYVPIIETNSHSGAQDLVMDETIQRIILPSNL